MVGQHWIGVGLPEDMESPVLDVAKAGRKTLADQSEQRKDMIAGAASIGKQLLDLQDRVVIEQAVENINGFALGRADRQNAEVAVLIGKPTVELRARLAAIVQIDVAALGILLRATEAGSIWRSMVSWYPMCSKGLLFSTSSE